MAHHAADAQGRCEGPDRHHRLAKGEGPRRRAHPDAVDAGMSMRASPRRKDMAADSVRATRPSTSRQRLNESGLAAELVQGSLIALRRSNGACTMAGSRCSMTATRMCMAYLRTLPKGSAPVVVAINMSATAKTVSLDLTAQNVTGKTVRTLAASDASLKSATSLQNVTLPPFSSGWRRSDSGRSKSARRIRPARSGRGPSLSIQNYCCSTATPYCGSVTELVVPPARTSCIADGSAIVTASAL